MHNIHVFTSTQCRPCASYRDFFYYINGTQTCNIDYRYLTVA
jgi:hypothetical protein